MLNRPPSHSFLFLDTDHIPQLTSRIRKNGPTVPAPTTRDNRARSSQSSNHTNPCRVSSPAQASRGHRRPTATKTASAAKKATTKKITPKDKRRAAVLAAEENAARLDACGYNEDNEEEVEVTDAQVDMQDVSDDGDEDEEQSPEALRRPRLTRGLSVEDNDAADDSEDDGITGLDNNHNSDSDDPANSPTRHRRQKDKSRGIKFIAVGSTTTIASKLPPKKPNKKASDQSSKGVRSPARTETITASPLLRSIRGTASSSSPRTPRKAIINAGRPRMVDQTPVTLGLLKAASSDTRQELAIKDAFPERVIFTENCKAVFLAACDSVQAVLHRQRFLKSDSYHVRILNILCQKLSQMRQEVRNAALAKTAIHYGISSMKNPADVVELVNRLKSKFAYVFADSGCVHSVLDDWSAGKNDASKNQFTHDKYAPIYHDHLANLSRFNEKAPAAVAKLQTSLWENAWASTGCALPDEGNVYIDDDVFAEAEAEALA
ncbi:hypothetical protein FRC01_012961 [Tulasnella sp. 417]|nr:hypothetical protein FRC01_012961 [Tulasnella sp. 417]